MFLCILGRGNLLETAFLFTRDLSFTTLSYPNLSSSTPILRHSGPSFPPLHFFGFTFLRQVNKSTDP